MAQESVSPKPLVWVKGLVAILVVLLIVAGVIFWAKRPMVTGPAAPERPLSQEELLDLIKPTNPQPALTPAQEEAKRAELDGLIKSDGEPTAETPASSADLLKLIK